MLQMNTTKALRSLSIFASFAGLGLLTSLPGLTQATPSTNPTTPSMTQPMPAPQSPSMGSPASPSMTTPASPSMTMPSSPSSTTPTMPQAAGSQSLAQLLQQASQAGSFKTLAKAIQASGVADAIPQGGKITVFAPTDAAFAELPAGTVEKLLKPENQALLRQLLAYHVVPQAVTSNQLKTSSVKTLGGPVSVRVSNGRVSVNNSNVIQADIQASDGVVHAINRVIIPDSLRQRLVSLR